MKQKKIFATMFIKNIYLRYELTKKYYLHSWIHFFQDSYK